MKIVILGDSNVGKTAILRRLENDEFRDCFSYTIEPEMISFELKKDYQTYKFSIWDTAGSEKYRAVSHLTLNGADAVILVYDVSKEESFLNLKVWNKMIENYCGEDIMCMLVGNKSDLIIEREVSFRDGRTIARFNEMEFAEMSPKYQSYYQLKQIFRDFFYQVIEKNKDRFLGQISEKGICLRKENLLLKKAKDCFSSMYQKMKKFFKRKEKKGKFE